MYTQILNGSAVREVSSTFAEILIGRAVICGYNVEKSSDSTITVRHNGNKTVFEYRGWSAEEEKALEEYERKLRKW